MNFTKTCRRWTVRGALGLALAAGAAASAQAFCPTANTQFQAYQADINGDGVADTLFVPVPTVILVPLGDGLVPLVVEEGLPAFNHLSSSSPALVGGVPANAVPVAYTAELMPGDANACGVLILRGNGVGLPTLVASSSPTGAGAPTLIQVLSAAAGASRKISYRYDERNRLLATAFGDGSPGITRRYTADGLLASITSGGSNGSTWTYGYNNRRLLTQESLVLGAAHARFARSYDSHGNLAQLTYPDGATVAYAPNALGLATQVSGHASDVTWAPNGALAGFTYANGIVHSVTQNVRGLTAQASDRGVTEDNYSYDEEANILAISDGMPGGIATRHMAYDGLDRLVIADSGGVWGQGRYGYDPLGNLRTSHVGSRHTTHVFDGANRLAQLVSNGVATNYGYDAQGNVTGKGNAQFLFDLGNRLIASGTSSYAYDGLGRRTVQNGTDGRQRVQMYSQDGQLLYGVHKPAGGAASSMRYVYLDGKVIAEVDSTVSGGVRYLHTDGLGSPVARTDATGALVDRTRYEPYGATAAGSVPGTGADNVGFTGHANDPDTGLVYMQQRYFDPVAARFLSVDPVTTDADSGSGFNRFNYANNNPYRYIDPDGRMVGILSPAGQAAMKVGSALLAKKIAKEAAAAAAGVAGGSAIVSVNNASDGEKNAPAPPATAAGAPAAGEEANSGDKPAGVPDNWRQEPTKADGGRQWVNPDSPGDRVRVMPGNPDSPNPGQREPYVRDVRNGNRWLDVNGNRVEGKTGRNSPDTHIPVKDYVFRP